MTVHINRVTILMAYTYKPECAKVGKTPGINILYRFSKIHKKFVLSKP